MTQKERGGGAKQLAGEASFICGVRGRLNFESVELFSTHHDKLEWGVRHKIIIVKDEEDS